MHGDALFWDFNIGGQQLEMNSLQNLKSVSDPS